MSFTKPTTVEVRLPSRMGFEKVAMSTASAVAKLMGFPDHRIEDLKTAVAEASADESGHVDFAANGITAAMLSLTYERAPGTVRHAEKLTIQKIAARLQP